MKLKQQVEDFQVEELTDVRPGEAGPFAFYRLEKCGWGTPEAIQAIRRRWHVQPGRVSFGGLKDRHAQTVQYVTIYRGPRRGVIHHGVTLHYLGQTESPYAAHDIRANRFRITLRQLTAADVERSRVVLDEVRGAGVPNYFDDQRFGSVSGGRFVAGAMVRDNFEEALRLALAEPYEYDRAPQKREKAILMKHWGDWPACKARLPRGHARSLADYLAHHPGDFKGALQRLRPELRGLYVSAYQSHLWNRVLARWLRQRLRPDQLVSVQLRLGEVPFHRHLDEEQRAELAGLRLPLPSSRTKLDAGDPRAELVRQVLAEEGLELQQLKGLPKMFFSKGERPALCTPSEFRYETADDELHPGRYELVLGFDLPRGCYATLIVKRVQQS